MGDLARYLSLALLGTGLPAGLVIVGARLLGKAAR